VKLTGSYFRKSSRIFGNWKESIGSLPESSETGKNPLEVFQNLQKLERIHWKSSRIFGNWKESIGSLPESSETGKNPLEVFQNLRKLERIHWKSSRIFGNWKESIGSLPESSETGKNPLEAFQNLLKIHWNLNQFPLNLSQSSQSTDLPNPKLSSPFPTLSIFTYFSKEFFQVSVVLSSSKASIVINTDL
jgi:hypothetical protein